MARHDHHRQARIARAQLQQPLETVDARHVEVEQRQIEGLLPGQQLERFADRLGLDRVDIGIGHPDGAVQRLAEQRVVVDDQESGNVVVHAASPPCPVVMRTG